MSTNIEPINEPGPWRGDSAQLESLVLEVWREVLSRQEIATTDNFFDLGGRSMHVMMMTNALQNKVGFYIPPALILRAQTISEIVAALMADRLGEEFDVLERLELE